MSAPIHFDYDKPMRSDFLLVKRAIKAGWPIAQATRESLVAFCMKAKLDGRADRIIELANETLDLLTMSIEKTAGLPEQSPLTTNPDDKQQADQAA